MSLTGGVGRRYLDHVLVEKFFPGGASAEMALSKGLLIRAISVIEALDEKNRIIDAVFRDAEIFSLTRKTRELLLAFHCRLL